MLRKLILLAVTGATLTLFSIGAIAKPPGIKDEEVGKKVFQFNLIGFPAGQAYTGNCGNGNRIFVNRNDAHAHIRIVDDNDGWWVSDCDATMGSYGGFHSDDVGSFRIFARILGKPGGQLKVCGSTLFDHAGDHLCDLGTFTMTRDTGKSSFGVKAKALFDANLEDIIWSLETNTNFRIVQFRVYEEL